MQSLFQDDKSEEAKKEKDSWLNNVNRYFSETILKMFLLLHAII